MGNARYLTILRITSAAILQRQCFSECDTTHCITKVYTSAFILG